MYCFSSMKLKNFKYTNKDKIGKDKYIFYRSFEGTATDLNFNKKQMLINHKKAIDSAIDYAYNQMIGPAKADVCHIIRKSDLHPKYAYQINKYAEYLYKINNNLLDKKKKHCIQK